MALTTSTGASFTSAPDWYNQYLSDLTSLAGTMAKSQYQPYQGPRVAEWTPDQQASFAATRDAQGMWQPYVQDALSQMTKGQGALQQMQDLTMGAARFDPSTYNQTYYGEVYEPAVQKMQQAAQSIGQRDFQNTTLKQLADSFTGSGQFGSARHQILGADAAAAAEARIQEQMAGIEMGARQNAMQDYLNWSKQQGNMGSQMGEAAGNYARAGTDLMNFGLANQQAAMADANALGAIGQQQQQQNQQNLNLAYQDFQDQQNFPWQQLDKWSSVLRGQNIPQYQSNVTLPSTAPQTTNPWTAGLGAAAGGWQMASAFGK